MLVSHHVVARALERCCGGVHVCVPSSVNERFARRGPKQTRENVDGGGLAGAIVAVQHQARSGSLLSLSSGDMDGIPQQTQQAALLHSQAQVVQCTHSGSLANQVSQLVVHN